MKTILKSALLTVWLIQGCSSSSVQETGITGYIENNSEYRGGANPPDFLLAQLALYKPSANQTFYVRNAANYAPFTPIITTFTTDANGNYTIDLPIGTYAIIGEDKYDFEQNPQATADCDYLMESDFTLTITTNQQNYNNQFTIKRNNCTTVLPN